VMFLPISSKKNEQKMLKKYCKNIKNELHIY